MEHRVVVTGIGAISPVGIGHDEFWKNLMAGKSGIDMITRFDPEEYPCKIAGEVKNFVPEDYVDKKEAKRMDLSTQFAVAASKLAIEDSKMDLEAIDKSRAGVIIATGIGGVNTLHDQYKTLFDKGPGRISPFFIPMMIANMAAGQTSIQFGFRGPCLSVVTACTGGANAIGEAMRKIQRGDADIMIAGGTEAAISPASVGGFCAMKALSTRNDEPQRASRPFQVDRDGFVMGEGAGVIIIESLEHAQARGAHIYAELTGYGTNADAHHITTPAPGGEIARDCMALALKDAKLDPAKVDYVNTHGTSTPAGDRNEVTALKLLFKNHVDKLAVGSTKSMTGHMLGAAGGIEAIACILAVQNDELPPTINCDNSDPELDLDFIPNIGRKQVVNAAISNSFGFGGHNGTLVIEKFKG